MEFRQLEYLIMAAEMGSFNKASEYLYTTQSNVSKVIRSLEKELGYSIFKRNGTGVALTEAGKILYNQSQQIMELLEKCATISDFAHKTCFHLASVVSNFIALNFADFVATHDCDELCVKMWEGSISRIIELVEQGEVEIAFMYLGMRQNDSFQAQLSKKGLYFQEILPAKVVVSVGPNNPLYHKKMLDAADLQSMKYVTCSQDNVSKAYHLKSIERDFHIEKNIADGIEVGSNYALQNLLKKTDRAYLCYGGLRFEQNGKEQDIKSVEIAGITDKVFLGYIHKKTEELSIYAKEFLELIQKNDTYAN